MHNKNLPSDYLKIIEDLRSRGESCITFNENTGVFSSRNGKHTFNYWIIDQKGELKCVDCKTVY